MAFSLGNAYVIEVNLSDEHNNICAYFIIAQLFMQQSRDYPPISCVVLLRCSSYKSTMIQMIGRGLRPIDASIYPNDMKTDCIVLDFGISTILHGNLEQEIQLKEELVKERDTCPDCKKKIPVSAEVCPLCNVEIEEAEEKQKIAKEKRVLERFVMAEINLLEKVLCLIF